MTGFSQITFDQLNGAAQSIRERAHCRRIWDMQAAVAAIWADGWKPDYSNAERAVLAGWSAEQAAKELTQ